MKIYLNTVGCRLNQSEIEKMANQFIAAGHVLVDRPDSADLVVVNTCSVTGQAAADSRRVLRLAKNSG
jgi:threonylcarbamoyladenosine tRNA methylthiotransferase MtaB